MSFHALLLLTTFANSNTFLLYLTKYRLQILAALNCFSVGGDRFHSKFDDTFATIFVLPSLSHHSVLVRLLAIESVGAALKVLPFQEKIVDDSLKLLPKIPTFCEDCKPTPAFSSWMRTQTNDSDDNCGVGSRTWMELRLCLEFDVISCLGVIGGATSDLSIMRSIVIKLINHSSRVSLQALCFHSLEYIAFKRKYSCLEDFFHVEQEFLIREWIGSEMKLTKIPTSVSSPPLLRRLIQFGLNEPKFTIIDIKHLNSRATKEYISKTASLVIPFVLLNERVVKDDQHNKIWEYLLEISDILNGGSSDSQIALLLTENLRDIYAYIFPLIHENNSRENSSSTQLMGSNALAHLRKYLSEEIIARQAGKESHYVVRQLLKLSGKNVIYNNNTTV